MHPTKNDLPEKSRTAACELLNARLADAIDLGRQIKHAHWNVKGPQFIALHELFDQIYDLADGWADDLAERSVESRDTIVSPDSAARHAARTLSTCAWE